MIFFQFLSIARAKASEMVNEMFVLDGFDIVRDLKNARNAHPKGGNGLSVVCFRSLMNRICIREESAVILLEVHTIQV